MSARWMENRKITTRFLITGTLTLLTPTRFGGGDPSQLTDMPLLRDPESNKPLLPGASIAGAMRAYLREWELGYEQADPQRVETRYQKLFGHVVDGNTIPENEKESLQSYLIIEDAIAEGTQTEFRPGVKIDPRNRTAQVEEKGGQLFDMELLQAGTKFELNFELDLPESKVDQTVLLEGIAIALTGFERKEIGLGARKRRGFGECQAGPWQVQVYDLEDPNMLLAWIEGASGERLQGANIADQLGLKIPVDDQRKRFCLEADFRLDTSLLIRSGSGAADSPDMVQLKSQRGGVDRPILSGTSLAGAIRGRALRISQNLIADKKQAKTLVAQLFGPDEIKERAQRKKDDQPWASRAVVREREVTNGYEHVQSRIRIDRFTGGTYPGALFEQQPVFGKQDTVVKVSIELHNPEEAHIGLLLQVLKDLWTGDLPLGGEASVGRGRLSGRFAKLSLHLPGQPQPETWVISALDEEGLNIIGDREKLESYAKAIGGGK